MNLTRGWDRLRPMGDHRLGVLVTLILALTVGTAFGQDRDVFEEAERRFSSGNYTLAIERYTDLLERFPGTGFRTEAQLRIGQSQYYLGDYAGARQTLERLAVRARGADIGAEIQLWIGLSSYQMNDPAAAEQAFSRHITDASDPRGRAWLYRGLARLDLGQVAAARADLDTAVVRTSGTEQAYAAAVFMESAAGVGLAADVDAMYQRVPVATQAEPYAEIRLRLAADAARALGQDAIARERYAALTGYSVASAQWAYRQLYAYARDAQDEDRMRRLYREAEQRLAGEPERLSEFWLALGADALRRERYELAELYLGRLWDVRSQRRISGQGPLFLARAITAQGRGAEARSLLLESLDDPGVDSTALRERVTLAARLAVEQGLSAEAATLLEERDAVESSAAALYLWAFGRQATMPDDVLERLSADANQPYLRDYAPLVRVRARLLLEAGRPEDAVRAYRVYLAERSEDRDARIELLRALTAAGQFAAVEQELERISRDGLDQERRAELTYLGAIAAFHRQDYAAAAASLTGLREPVWEPGRSYHLAWSRYRTGDISGARSAISEVVDRLPPELAVDGRYLYAWTLYRGGAVDRARGQLLQILGSDVSAADQERTRRLLATVYLEEGRYEEARSQYETLATAAPGRAEQAAYLRRAADALVAGNQMQAAISRYDALSREYADLAVGRLVLLEAGELLYAMGDAAAARERFRRYQERYPDGAELDRALYWAGLTSYELGEAGRSLLWWEPLITRYPDSRFTPEVLFLTAEIYAARDQRRQALELYDRLVAAYPDSNRSEEAERRRRTIRLELDGLSAREAGLWVELESQNGPEPGTERWFDVILQLGRIAIREQITLTAERARIVDRLLEAADYEGPRAAEASLLLAEYYRRRGETNAAVRRYVEAAGTDGAPDELRAQSLYELASLARDAGDPGVALDALDELQERYPESIWADRAERLMEGLR